MLTAAGMVAYASLRGIPVQSSTRNRHAANRFLFGVGAATGKKIGLNSKAPLIVIIQHIYTKACIGMRSEGRAHIGMTVNRSAPSRRLW